MRFFKLSLRLLFMGFFFTGSSVYGIDKNFSLTPDCSKGGCIKVINENQKPLTLKIMPQTRDTQGASTKEYTIELAAGRESTFMVQEDQLRSKIFKISGSTHLFTPNGTCENLNILDNYELILTNNVLGTTCHAHKVETGVSKEK